MIQDIMTYINRDIFLSFNGTGSQMGCGDYLWQFQQFVILKRLFFKYVNRRTRNFARDERVIQRFFVYDAATSAVNDVYAVFHLPESITVNHMARFFHERCMDGNVICFV